MFTPAVIAHVALLAKPWAASESLIAQARSLDVFAGPPGRNAAPRTTRTASIRGRAHIPVQGPILGQRPTVLTLWGMGCCTSDIRAAMRAAVADPDVNEIVLEVDSDGGSVEDIPELAKEIRECPKVTTALVRSTAASAAFWLASQCSRVVLAPSGQVGGIGCYVIHEDISKALEIAGKQITLVSAGPHKVENAPYGPLGKDAKAYMQANVDRLYRWFVDDVARGRGVSPTTVRNTYGGGRMLHADAALKVGMVDAVAADLSTVRTSGRFAQRKVAAMQTRDLMARIARLA